MKRAAKLFSIIFILFPFIIKAQGEAALPSLGLNPNPQSFGMGMSGVSLPTNDPLGFYFNPAMLGYASQSSNLAIQFYTDKINRQPTYYYFGATNNNIGITAGYNFGNIFKGLNLSGGVGFISSKLDYGTFAYVDNYANKIGYYDIYDQYNAYAIGVSVDYAVNLSLGLTFKRIDSKLSPLPHGEAFINAIDWGMLLNIPISKLAAPNFVYRTSESTGLKPAANLSFGYSRSNIGNEVFYADAAQKDALPLTGRLGYTLSLGADLLLRNNSINLFTFDISIEAEDLLVSSDYSGKFSYQGLLGDIKTLENLFEWKRTTNVTLRKGQKISLFETVSFLMGSFYNYSPNRNTTEGIMISSNGIFKLLSLSFDGNGYIKFILDHFEFQYVKASWNPHLEDVYLYPAYLYPVQYNTGTTDMEAISISFKGFSF